MIFTFTLRFPLWRRGTTCTLPDKPDPRGGKKQAVFGIFPSPCCFYGWVEGVDGFPHQAAQLLWEVLITHIRKDVKNVGKDERL